MATPGPGQARQPTSAVLVNGTQTPCQEWAVTSNGFYRADTFSASIPISSLPQGVKISDLSDADQITVEIRLSVDGSTPTSLITGIVSDFEIDWPHRSLSISGRDHTADFIEAKTAEKFLNQTASQIVQTLAGRHGLSANVKATSTKAGKYYEIDHDKLTDEITEWDLITYLAQKENYYAWVSGTTLNFQPADEVVGTPIKLQYTPPSQSRSAQAPFTGLKTTRNLTLASDIAVIAWSWNHKQKTPFKRQAKATKSQKSQSSGGKGQVYTFRAPGLTSDQAQKLAESKLEALSRHERLIEVDLPPDVTTTPRNQINLSGTGTGFDQLYWIDEVERRLSFSEFTQTVRGKNHSPQSVVSA